MKLLNGVMLKGFNKPQTIQISKWWKVASLFLTAYRDIEGYPFCMLVHCLQIWAYDQNASIIILYAKHMWFNVAYQSHEG